MHNWFLTLGHEGHIRATKTQTGQPIWVGGEGREGEGGGGWRGSVCSGATSSYKLTAYTERERESERERERERENSEL